MTIILLCTRIPQKKWSNPHCQQKSKKCSIWAQPQKQQNDLGSFPRQAIQITVTVIQQPMFQQQMLKKLINSMKTYKSYSSQGIEMQK